MSQAWLSLGSNVDATTNIRAGVNALRSRFGECRLSPVYRSAAVGFDGEDFLNLAAVIETRLTPMALREWIRKLEDRHGRDRSLPRFSDRALDIDILLFDDLVIHDESLEIPRLEILKSPHVLKPLADLSPELIHPSVRRSLAEIWAESAMDASALTETPIELD
jgi:2-amino-4-hydroxy-6-hydroxymethyldihydropteridine diphosphokinase